MFSKILLLTDETTEDRRVSADRRSLPPPPLLKDRTMAMVRFRSFQGGTLQVGQHGDARHCDTELVPDRRPITLSGGGR